VHCAVRSHNITIIYVIYYCSVYYAAHACFTRDGDIGERSFPPTTLPSRDRSTGHRSFNLSDSWVVVVKWGRGDNRWPRGRRLIRQCSITGARYARLTFRDPVGKFNSIIILFWTAHNWFSVRRLYDSITLEILPSIQQQSLTGLIIVRVFSGDFERFNYYYYNRRFSFINESSVD